MKLDEPITVVIADDHPFIRIGVRNLLEKTPDILVIGEASNGKEAIDIVEMLCPDILILDLQMPVMDGFETLQFLADQRVEITVLILSAEDDTAIKYAVSEMGAHGYCVKGDNPEKILEAVYQAMA